MHTDCLSTVPGSAFLNNSSFQLRFHSRLFNFSSLLCHTTMHLHVLHIVLFSALLSAVLSHSFLIVPKGDFVSFLKPECRLGGPSHAPNDTCPGPCISEDRWQFDKNATITMFQRGQNATIVWPRNNHEGGFVRFTMVPHSDRMNPSAHTRMVFHYACFESDRVPCEYSYCGTDSKNTVFQTSVTIPSIYPDGLYVLGWAWFGGIVNRESYFGDYWSCSFIKIRGGAPLQETYQPVFIPGKKNKGAGGVGTSSCRSAVNNVGICVTEPCLGHTPSFVVPSSFENSHAPPPIYAYWLNARHPRSSAKPAQLPSATDSVLTAVSPPKEVLSTALAPTPSTLASPVFSSFLPPAPHSPMASILASTAFFSSPLMNSLESNPVSSPEADSPAENQNTPGPEYEKNAEIEKVIISSVKMVDIHSNDLLATGDLGTVSLSKQQLRQITFVAETTGRTSSVEFYIDNRYVRTERRAPYSCFGDKHGNLNPWPTPILNRWVLVEVRAYSPDNFMNPRHVWFRILQDRQNWLAHLIEVSRSQK